MTKTQHGFGLVGIIVIIAAIGVAGLIGWRVWDSMQKKDQATTQQPDKAPATATIKQNTLSLAGQKVTFTLPESWTYVTGDDKCRRSVSLQATCLEGAVITPGAQLPTRYGDGTEYFYVYVSVYENSANVGPKQWLEDVAGEGTGSGQVTTSSDSINGYDTFYRQEQYDGDGTTVRQMWYVFTADSKVVVMKARTYEPGKLANGTAVGDFREFEAPIQAAAKTIVIKP